MDVLVLIHNQSETGPYHKGVEMCHALGRLGHRVTLLCTSKAARVRCVSRRDGEVEIVEAPDLLWGRLRQGVDLWNCLRRIWFLARRRFDVVYAIDTTSGEVRKIAVGKEPHGLTVWPQPGRYSLGHTGNMR